MFIQINRSKRGFSLVELVVAVTIAGLIIIGVSVFLTRVNTDITTSTVRSKIYTDLSLFLDRTTELRRSYPQTTLIDYGTGAYDAVMLTNSGRTAGVLIGVVDRSPESLSLDRLTPPAEFATYGRNILSVGNLTQAQVASIIASPLSATGVVFGEDGGFSGLNVSELQINLYNTGSIVDAFISIHEWYSPSLLGKSRLEIPFDNPVNYVLNF